VLDRELARRSSTDESRAPAPHRRGHPDGNFISAENAKHRASRASRYDEIEWNNEKERERERERGRTIERENA